MIGKRLNDGSFFKVLDMIQRKIMLCLAAAAALFLGLFLKLTNELFERGGLDRVDRTILTWVGAHRFSALNGIAITLTQLGSPVFLPLLAFTVILLLIAAKDSHSARYLALISVGAGIASLIVKPLIGRERPAIIPRLIEVTGLSYPSGHSLGATSIYLTLGIVACKYLNTRSTRAVTLFGASLLILLVGFSRIYLGVHYPSDVASGMLLGLSWVLTVTAFFYPHDNYISASHP